MPKVALHPVSLSCHPLSREGSVWTRVLPFTRTHGALSAWSLLPSPSLLLCLSVSISSCLSLKTHTHTLFMNQYKDISYILSFDSRSLILAEHGLQIEHLPGLLLALSEHPLTPGSQGCPVSGLLKWGRIFVLGSIAFCGL